MTEAQIFGYQTHDLAYPHAPGCAALDVVLRDTPSEEHFDPEKIILTIATPSGDIQHTVITSQAYTGTEPMRVCAGRIVLVDRLEKRVQFLTMGGVLKITHEDGRSLCQLRSGAPIIALALSRQPREILAEEIEKLLAQRRAAHTAHPREFERRLAEVEADVLYLACLTALAHKLKGVHPGPDEDMHVLAQFVDAELAILWSQGAASARPMEEIL